MRLSSRCSSVDLEPVAYQFPDRPGVAGGWDWDANWLVVRGRVSDGALEWSFEDPCLTTREAQTVSEWLGGVARGEATAGDQLYFLEPNLRFEYRGQVTGRLFELAIFFAQESSPPDATDEMRYGEGRAVTVQLRVETVQAAVSAWSRELSPFPVR